MQTSSIEVHPRLAPLEMAPSQVEMLRVLSSSRPTAAATQRPRHLAWACLSLVTQLPRLLPPPSDGLGAQCSHTLSPS